ncbi:hypothetical protein [Sphingomonas sp. DT-204]|uniref:hypothetical protein n=1 Tax=Sphingomonas sp. DT-204 TaxID=3396166 RepID=UPI003F1A32BD
MMETWRRWNYARFSNKIGSSDDFAKFEGWASGPWTPAIARKIPTPELLAGPPMGSIDAQTRKIIDLEITRRAQPVSPMVANIIAILALIVSVIALFKDN